MPPSVIFSLRFFQKQSCKYAKSSRWTPAELQICSKPKPGEGGKRHERLPSFVMVLWRHMLRSRPGRYVEVVRSSVHALHPEPRQNTENAMGEVPEPNNGIVRRKEKTTKGERTP
jgi:hypothetical protein